MTSGLSGRGGEWKSVAAQAVRFAAGGRVYWATAPGGAAQVRVA